MFVFHDMTEAERISEELKTRNGLLQQAGRLARLGAWEYDLTKGLLYWSDMCFEIHGLPAETPLPENYIAQYVAPEYQAELRQKLHDCIDHRQEQSMDLEILRADGRRLWIRARCEAVLPSVTVVTQNIDGLHQAAGSRRVLELHGSLWKLRCDRCGWRDEDRSAPVVDHQGVADRRCVRAERCASTNNVAPSTVATPAATPVPIAREREAWARPR